MSELFPVDSRKKFSVPMNPPVDDPSLYAKPKPAIVNYSKPLTDIDERMDFIDSNLCRHDNAKGSLELGFRAKKSNPNR